MFHTFLPFKCHHVSWGKPILFDVQITMNFELHPPSLMDQMSTSLGEKSTPFPWKTHGSDVYIMLKSFIFAPIFISFMANNSHFLPIFPRESCHFPPSSRVHGPPWTAPSHAAAERAAPSLCCGCCVITRPPTLTRLSAQPRKSCSRRSWGQKIIWRP